MKQILKNTTSALLVLLLLLSSLWGCTSSQTPPEAPPSGTTALSLSAFHIQNGGKLTLKVGNSVQLHLITDASIMDKVIWSTTNSSATVSNTGLVTGIEEGIVAVSATYLTHKSTVLFEIISPASSPLPDAGEKEDFYGDYDPASSPEEALKRSEKGLLSGSLTVPDEAPTLSSYRPMEDGKYVRNSEAHYIGTDTYVVVDAWGREIFRIYRGGGYITLEEVAAYLYAFGDVPANYVSGKNMSPQNSIWGEYLRLNHNSFSGDTSRYPYEPELPRINGCGGDLYYYEIDIGTTGTTCDDSYAIRIYNDGTRITRGAARIVYTRYDKNRNEIIDPNEKYIFYTYNHYNDFQEYLNYYGGWGEMFGNITGGGTLSSKKDYNPTPYAAVIRKPIVLVTQSAGIDLYQPVYFVFTEQKAWAA